MTKLIRLACIALLVGIYVHACAGEAGIHLEHITHLSGKYFARAGSADPHHERIIAIIA
jgi:hypothetical protein